MVERLTDLEPVVSESLFNDAIRRDSDALEGREWQKRWLFADVLAARAERSEMSFAQYEGPGHLRKFFAWLQGASLVDYLPVSLSHPLAEKSIERDLACLRRLDVSVPGAWIARIAQYNAQDWCFQRMYPVPERQRVKVLLDFGAGHGRMANLAFASPESSIEKYIAIDAIPSSYLTQRAYYYGLELHCADYIDLSDSEKPNIFSSGTPLIHLPTWRMDLVPDASVDMVCCVQVLKELPRRLANWAIEQFSRVLKPGGALYVRDHRQFHHPNSMPIEELLLAHGITSEYSPQVYDRSEVFGVPRIWRKFDVNLYLKADD